MAKDGWTRPAREALRPDRGFRLADLDPSSTPGWKGDSEDAEARLAEVGLELAELQERLFAQSRTGGSRSVLLVLQGMDTSGKGGIVRHVIGYVEPQGVTHRAFGVPTEQERAHHYLWRIGQALPEPGRIGVFDRSHYEDVLVVRVHDLVPPTVWGARYEEINDFEKDVVDSGTTVVKVALVISPDEQRARLRERLDREDKRWKYKPGDLDERVLWPRYTEAYQAVFDRTNTDRAPWFVIPADRKWYARLAVAELLTQALRDLDPRWPPVTFDVEAEKDRLDAQVL
ncbi:PPK2 family polyphosphate kinase [Pengzhenrongella frigida]|uniref:Polyphosphate kinase 2 family protein n=1 Tax=Pengzhenrongella frigida TaxID=1259133 RepID=A0A4Q5MXQ9_9MICO|nr:PPK2 family polyphosphate kinase [Cellulomonas sp. HLT2-17]RYV50415.1 polyphosphate kinase 2 family protein [Cellulomonas sp. HLT2-17]